MSYYEIFAATCSSEEEINRRRQLCHALELPYPISVPTKIKAESQKDATKKYQKSEEFKAFIDNLQTEGTIHFFEYLANGRYRLIF